MQVKFLYTRYTEYARFSYLFNPSSLDLRNCSPRPHTWRHGNHLMSMSLLLEILSFNYICDRRRVWTEIYVFYLFFGTFRWVWSLAFWWKFGKIIVRCWFKSCWCFWSSFMFWLVNLLFSEKSLFLSRVWKYILDIIFKRHFLVVLDNLSLRYSNRIHLVTIACQYSKYYILCRQWVCCQPAITITNCIFYRCQKYFISTTSVT